MAKRGKDEIITFKVGGKLADLMRGMANRSEFIRSAILAAMENTCPLCMGTGILSAEQRTHWDQFSADHSLHTCDDCEAVHLVCNANR